MRGEGTDGGAAHVLVAGANATAADADVPVPANALGVTYDADAESWLGDFQDTTEQVAVVSVGERSRSAAASAALETGPDAVTAVSGAVETVQSVGDVATVGTLVNDYLSAWRGETAVYVDDLSTLVADASAETAFRFLHALVACVSAQDGRVVAGFDTTDQPPHVAATFAELFDDVRELP